MTDSSQPSQPAPRAGRHPVVRVAIVVGAWLAGVVAFSIVLKLVWNAQEFWATIGLSVAAGSLVFALLAMYRMARALGTPAVEFELARTAAAATRSRRFLREERRRLLRAINELRFDHEMGKLSAADYKSVRQTYELQAVEVMRALESEESLHPEVASLLKEIGLAPDGEPLSDEAREAASEDEPPAVDADPSNDSDGDASEEGRGEPEASTPEPDADHRVCGACDKPNDIDASFCKHCGKGLEA